MINTSKIVITGGPGGGKTTIINSLKGMGYYCYDEISRELILKFKKKYNKNIFFENPLEFSNILWEKREEQYKNSMTQKEYDKVFFDRGLLDVTSYLEFIGKRNLNLERKVINFMYDIIFLVKPTKKFYKKDFSRYEDFSQSIKIHNILERNYKNHFKTINVPFEKLKDRLNFIVDFCQKL